MSSHIEYQSLEEMKLFLKAGEGRISVTLSLPNASGIGQVSSDKKNGNMYALNGSVLRQEPLKGIYIKNGKKIIR